MAGSNLSGAAHLRWRYAKDVAARYAVLIGGLGVIVALLLIFVYLVLEIVPLFRPADVDMRASFAAPGAAEALYLAAEEQGKVGMRIGTDGAATFFDLDDGAVRRTLDLTPESEARPTGVVAVAPQDGLLAAALDDGRVLPFRHSYRISYPDNRRRIEAQLSYPFGENGFSLAEGSLKALAVREDGERLLIAAALDDRRVRLKRIESITSFTGETEVTENAPLDFEPAVRPDRLLLDPQQTWLYVLDARGEMAFYRLSSKAAPELVQRESLGAPLADASFLPGGVSILTATRSGDLRQWFPARRDGRWYLAGVRRFDSRSGAGASALGVEQRRRGFAVGHEDGHIDLFYATSKRHLAGFDVEGAVTHLNFNPRAQVLLAATRGGQLHVFDVHNEHPETSLGSLWGKVWYESYDEPRWLWQSSSASADFEPKFSLTPITVGTLKGAFYAMIFAVPLAILGAIFTANFMSPRLRQAVKPTVELMQALPTVILGFLAGLWLAPFVERNLAGVFLLLVLLPLSIPVFGFVWLQLPKRVRYWVPSGWEALLMVPVIAVITWFCFVLAKPIEAFVFGGNLQIWMDHVLGIGYDQRNALVVGIAMGVAVVPVIFSIAEDAIFDVPKHLSLGSLALGATPWQTLVGVVLPTASPGIFSAVMIGMGRAVGETMIVLMATGNTPVMDFSLFSGMRTLSANIAVEMPEAEVGSTHFRLLFVAGIVLFVMTFVFNTLAEVVRQRLRRKYASI